jgi:hypothetical protein
LKIKEHNKEEMATGRFFAEHTLEAEEKLDELISIIIHSGLDDDSITRLRQKFNHAIELNGESKKAINAFKVIDSKDDASREDLLNEFSTLLLSNKIDSKISSSYLKARRTSRLFLMLVGMVMITLGFAMIIMPAPPYFEMFTIYYFSQDDGVTLMDLISLAIIFAGIFVFIRSIYKKPVK